MRYRSLHNVQAPGFMSNDDLRATFMYGAPVDTTVRVRKSGIYRLVSVDFSAHSDAMAKDQAAQFRRDANILGPSDHEGLQVKTRQGWKNLL